MKTDNEIRFVHNIRIIQAMYERFIEKIEEKYQQKSIDIHKNEGLYDMLHIERSRFSTFRNGNGHFPKKGVEELGIECDSLGKALAGEIILGKSDFETLKDRITNKHWDLEAYKNELTVFVDNALIRNGRSFDKRIANDSEMDNIANWMCENITRQYKAYREGTGKTKARELVARIEEDINKCEFAYLELLDDASLSNFAKMIRKYSDEVTTLEKYRKCKTKRK